MSQKLTAIRFLRDYRGKLTNEQFYTAGTVVEFHPLIADAIIDEGAAEPGNAGDAVESNEYTAPGEKDYSKMTKSELVSALVAHDVNLDDIPGTGKDGNIINADLIAALQEAEAAEESDD